MTDAFLFDLVISVFHGVMARIDVREAALYKRNKNKKKEFIKRHSTLCNILRAYLPKETYAPRNMLYFQCFRISNYILLIASICVYFMCAAKICGVLFYAKMIVLHGPFALYNIYALLKGPLGKKNIDFSIFKDP